MHLSKRTFCFKPTRRPLVSEEKHSSAARYNYILIKTIHASPLGNFRGKGFVLELVRNRREVQLIFQPENPRLARNSLVRDQQLRTYV